MKNNKLQGIWLLLVLFTSFCACKQQNTIPSGDYYAILPCSDCQAIYYKITFNSDSTYTEERFYQGGENEQKVNEGFYKVKNDSVLLVDNTGNEKGRANILVIRGKQQLLLVGHTGLKGKTNGDRIIFKKEKPGNFINSMKTNHNTDRRYFKATGNEPFWHLQIFGKQRLMFNSIDKNEFDISASLSRDVISTVESSERIYTITINRDSLNLTIRIKKEECIDDMSGFKFPYTVKIAIKIPSDSIIFTGCGKYMGDYRLHDIWALEKINEKKIDVKTERPRLEFNLSGGKFHGYAGCNNIDGSMKVSEDSIIFDAIRATKTTCPDRSVELRFLNILREDALAYSFDNLNLILRSDENQLTFRKVD